MTAGTMKMEKSNKLLPLLRLRFAPALPLRGTPSGTAYAKRRRSTQRNRQPTSAPSLRGGHSPSLSACINQSHNLQHN